MGESESTESSIELVPLNEMEVIPELTLEDKIDAIMETVVYIANVAQKLEAMVEALSPMLAMFNTGNGDGPSPVDLMKMLG